ncbi:DUF86 domain-containing protein [Burkholderia ubonensis]|uniref:HepT-like ribonuclease domain-containing protein n=1 Tax=Burkholderia ubonensis TaxID=101571 RepID=UPI0039F5A659
MSVQRLPDHIQHAATGAHSFVKDLTRGKFRGGGRIQQARHHELHPHWRSNRKGGGRVTEFVQAQAKVPWRKMRNRVAHGYFGIDFGMVCETTQQLLREMFKQLSAARRDAEGLRSDGTRP